MEKTINFLKYKYIAVAASWIFILGLTAGTIINGGFNYGIDFVGGYKVIAKISG